MNATWQGASWFDEIGPICLSLMERTEPPMKNLLRALQFSLFPFLWVQLCNTIFMLQCRGFMPTSVLLRFFPGADILP